MNLLIKSATISDPGSPFYQQIADVLTYVRKSFGNKANRVTAAEVKKVRAGNKT